LRKIAKDPQNGKVGLWSEIEGRFSRDANKLVLRWEKNAPERCLVDTENIKGISHDTATVTKAL
jgi:hypothetical protein